MELALDASTHTLYRRRRRESGQRWPGDTVGTLGATESKSASRPQLNCPLSLTATDLLKLQFQDLAPWWPMFQEVQFLLAMEKM